MGERNMTVLVDHQIAARQNLAQPLATHVSANDFEAATSKIQAASMDLTIGEIYIPGTESNKPGGAQLPLREYPLGVGHTAVIRTKEVLHLSADLAGIAFPPASVSIKGLLMTNPGHIDPEYTGPLHLTVINMSDQPFSLREGDRIIRVLFLNLAAVPRASYHARHPDPLQPVITPTLLQKLSIDFVNVTKRAQTIAKGAVKKAQFSAVLISVIIPGAIAVLVNFYSPPWRYNLERQIAGIEATSNIGQIQARIKNVEDDLRAVKETTCLRKPLPAYCASLNSPSHSSQ